MARYSWKPLSPFLPLQHRASFSLTLSDFATCHLLPPLLFFPCPVCSGSRHTHFSIFPLRRWLSLPRRPEVPRKSPGRQPSPQGSRKEKAEQWGASLTACQGSLFPSFLALKTLQNEPGRLPSSCSPGAQGRAAGKTSCSPRSLSFPSFSPLMPVQGSHSRQPRLREGWGGAAELRRRQGCF